jgi:hypothetical protein
MGPKRIAAMGMIGVLLGAGSLIASAGGASASVATANVVRRTPRVCATKIDDRWPGWVDGRPKSVDPKTAAGVYMWHDAIGWHIRATHRGRALRTFSGRLETTGRFVGVRPVRLEGHDSVTVAADHHAIAFSFNNYGAIDGLNFRTLCAPSISFDLGSDGVSMPPAFVKIGSAAVNPATDPFVISRG